MNDLFFYNPKPKEFYYHPDVNGRYIVNLQNSWDSDSEADYYFTHFKLPVEEPFFNAQVYIIGEITGNTTSEDIIDQIFKKFCLGK